MQTTSELHEKVDKVAGELNVRPEVLKGAVAGWLALPVMNWLFRGMRQWVESARPRSLLDLRSQKED